MEIGEEAQEYQGIEAQYAMDTWESGFYADNLEGSLLPDEIEPLVSSYAEHQPCSSGSSHPITQILDGLGSKKSNSGDTINTAKVSSDIEHISCEKQDPIFRKDLRVEMANLRHSPYKSCDKSKTKLSYTEDMYSQKYAHGTCNWQTSDSPFLYENKDHEAALELFNNRSKKIQSVGLVNTNGNAGAVDLTPNTISDICLSGVASVSQECSVEVGPYCETRSVFPEPSAHVNSMCHASMKKFPCHSSTLRRIPQGDGLGPLKPWPAFDYGMSGEEYLSLFEQRNIRLRALQSDQGFHLNTPADLTLESMIPPAPLFSADWHQAAAISKRDDEGLDYTQKCIRSRSGSLLDNYKKMAMQGVSPDSCKNVQQHLEQQTLNADIESWRDYSRFCNRNLPATAQRQRTNPIQHAVQPHFIQTGSLAGYEGGLGHELLPMRHQDVPDIPDIFDGLLESAATTLGELPEETNFCGDTPANMCPKENSAVPSVDPAEWVSRMMAQIKCDGQKQKSEAFPKDDGDDDSVVFFHNTSFEPIDPPWENSQNNCLDMKVEEGPFPDDPEFDINCFGVLTDQLKVLDPPQHPSNTVQEEKKDTSPMSVTSNGDQPENNPDFDCEGFKACGEEEYQVSANEEKITLPKKECTHKTKRKRSRHKSKDGKPRIYPRIPKITSLLPRCINEGLLETMIEDLQSHVKDYINDPEAVDRLVQDIVSYLALLHRLERNNQKADWCEGCLEVLLYGLHNSRVNPVDAVESGLIAALQRIAKMKNARLPQVACIALKEDWALQSLTIIEQDECMEPTLVPKRKKHKKNK